jgi:hypothetical protein
MSTLTRRDHQIQVGAATSDRHWVGGLIPAGCHRKVAARKHPTHSFPLQRVAVEEMRNFPRKKKAVVVRPTVHWSRTSWSIDSDSHR